MKPPFPAQLGVPASGVSVTPGSGITATDVQSALVQLQTQINQIKHGGSGTSGQQFNPYISNAAYSTQGITDYNQLTLPGLYEVNGVGQANGPASDNTNGFIAVYKASGAGHLTQQWFNRGSSVSLTQLWMRESADGGTTWTAWQKIGGA